jgi:hypothetical protein
LRTRGAISLGHRYQGTIRTCAETSHLQSHPNIGAFWLSEQLVSYHVPYDVTCNVLGVVTEEDKLYERLKLILLTPGSPAERYLANKNGLGYYILMMNGVRIRSVSDIRLILHDYHEQDEV